MICRTWSGRSLGARLCASLSRQAKAVMRMVRAGSPCRLSVPQSGLPDSPLSSNGAAGRPKRPASATEQATSARLRPFRIAAVYSARRAALTAVRTATSVSARGGKSPAIMASSCTSATMLPSQCGAPVCCSASSSALSGCRKWPSSCTSRPTATGVSCATSTPSKVGGTQMWTPSVAAVSALSSSET